MILAPLQLVNYWMESIHIRANPKYQANQPSDLDANLIELETDVKELPTENAETHGTRWGVQLFISQRVPDGKNIPYDFAIQLTGIVLAHPSLKDDKLRGAIEVNGPSMLFGSAREIIRAATSRGPFAPVIIPSTNFFQRIPKPQLSSATETKVEKKTSGSRKKRES